MANSHMKITTEAPPSPPKTPSAHESDAGQKVGVSKEELSKLNLDCQNLWDRKMWDFGYTTSFYVKVAVLMVSWDAPFDDLKTESEVNDLAAIFGEKYNFNVSFLKLKEIPRKRTQVQLKAELAVFVKDHDDEDTLLIIYYAGHGFVRDDNPGQMELRGWRAPNEPGDANKVVWNNVENILDDTSSDVLEIMDCCYAGDLGEPKRGRTAWCDRAFEYIGATSAGALTNSPGKTSFTSALIWALNQFALPESHKNFTVTDLVAKIREYDDFPKDQVPVSRPRNVGKIERMVLGPIPTDEETIRERQKANAEVRPLSSRYNVRLAFDFNELPTIDAIDGLANELKYLGKKKGVDVRRISWEGVESGLTPLIQEVVDRLKRPLRKKSEVSSASLTSSPVAPMITCGNMNVYVPDTNTAKPLSPPQQMDLQCASFHIKMFWAILWVMMTCAVATMTAKVKVVVLILTSIVAFVTILSIIPSPEASELDFGSSS